jgi:adenylate kinase family enzyme
MQIPDEEGVVIDGFPRDVAQALSFEDQVRMSPCILIDPLFA